MLFQNLLATLFRDRLGPPPMKSSNVQPSQQLISFGPAWRVSRLRVGSRGGGLQSEFARPDASNAFKGRHALAHRKAFVRASCRVAAPTRMTSRSRARPRLAASKLDPFRDYLLQRLG
jgi:hypothetical protein